MSGLSEKERDNEAEALSQCQGEAEFLKGKLDCYLPPELTIEKLVRRGQYASWLEMTRAAPGDTIQFRVVIRGAAKNVYLRDILPIGFGEVSNLRVDGEPVHDGDISELFLSNIVGESEITYESRLSHSLGEVTLVNQVVVWADCLEEQSSQVTVEVKPRPVSPPSQPSKPPKDDEKSGGPGPDPKIPDP